MDVLIVLLGIALVAAIGWKVFLYITWRKSYNEAYNEGRKDGKMFGKDGPYFIKANGQREYVTRKKLSQIKEDYKLRRRMERGELAVMDDDDKEIKITEKWPIQPWEMN